MSFVSPAGKPATDPATVGDVLEYKVTIPNSGTSTAFDANIVDTLPANVALVAGSATATINGVAVTGFVANPSTPSGTTLVWGRGNGDGSLDIPAGQSLVLTYQVTVVDASSVSSFTNSAYVDWTSLDEDYPIDPISNPSPGRERTGAGCPTTTLPNNYCTGPASVTVYTVDNTSIAKSVNTDSYVEIRPALADHDRARRRHRHLRSDAEPAGIHDPERRGRGCAARGHGAAKLYHHPVAQLQLHLGGTAGAGATGTLRWEFGDIINDAGRYIDRRRPGDPVCREGRD